MLILPQFHYGIYIRATHVNCLTILQKYGGETTVPVDDTVVSFTWDIKDFPASLALQLESQQEPLTSDTFSCERQRWRSVLTCDKNLYLQLMSSSHPVTVLIR